MKRIKEKYISQRIIWLLATVLITSSSCETDELENPIGLGLMTSDSYIVRIDTLSVKTSTIMFDSTLTSSNNFGLVGSLDDSIIGQLYAESYFKLDLDSYILIDDKEVCDSINLTINLAEFYMGDTSSQIELFVHEITGEYELPENGYFYNNDKVSYSSEPVGSLLFIPSEIDSTLSIPMNPQFTERIFNILQKIDGSNYGDEYFQDYVKGFVLRTSNNANLIFSIDFTATTGLKIYTSRSDLYQIQRIIEINYSDSEYQFHHFTIDNSNTAFSNLSGDNEINSYESNNRSLILPALGIFTKLNFPSLESLLQISEYGTVLKAELTFIPEESNKHLNPYPSELFFYIADKYNYPEEVMLYNSGSTVTAYIVEDPYYDENPEYSFNITDYLITELSDHYIDPKKSLLISSGSTAGIPSLNSLLLMDDSNPKSSPKLIIYYLHL